MLLAIDQSVSASAADQRIKLQFMYERTFNGLMFLRLRYTFCNFYEKYINKIFQSIEYINKKAEKES